MSEENALAVLPEDVASEDADLTLLDESVAIGRWEPVETGLAQAKYNPELAVRVCAGMKLAALDDRGERKPLLYYQIRNRGSGLNAQIARALVSAVGNFETVSILTEIGVMPKSELGPHGEFIVTEVPAVRATASVRDGTTGTVNMAVKEEALFERRSKDRGGGWYARDGEQCADIARSKAVRNARLEHFGAVTGALLAAVKAETESGNEYFSGEPGALRGSEATREAIMAEREAADTIGTVRAKAFVDEVSEFANSLSPEERQRFSADLTERLLPRLGIPKLTPPNLAGIRETRLQDCETWLSQMRLTLGGEAEEAPTEPGPTTGADMPTPEVVRDLIRAYEEGEDPEAGKAFVAEVFAKTKIPRSGDWGPEQCQELYVALMEPLTAGTA